MIKDSEMTVGDARQLIDRCLADLMATQEKVGGYCATTTEADLELMEQREQAREYITMLKGRLGTSALSEMVQVRTEALLVNHGFDLAAVPPARMKDLYEGVARALVEQQNLFLTRLEGRLADFRVSDPLLLSSGTMTGFPTSEAGVQGNGVTPVAKGPTVDDAVKSYLRTHQKVWKPRTYKARDWQLRYLVEFLTPERPLISVLPADIRAFRDGILSLRANHGRSQTQSFAQKQTENSKARIKGKTATLIFEPAKAFFRWAKSQEGLIERNPAEDIQILVEKRPKGERSRRPFEAAEIVQLFSCSLFTGCKSEHRRFETGAKVVRDGKFWLPILGYYTGCRLGELVQLSIADAQIACEFPHLDINEKVVAGSDGKSVKSEAGIRCVPLHPDLLSLGFGEFVEKRRTQDKANVRLFKEIKYGCDNQASTEYSKIFARLMEKVGLNDPRLVFHSWRHGVEDALRDAGVQPYAIDRIVGHADNTMGGKYGNGVSLSVLFEAVSNMKLPVSLTTVVALPKCTAAEQATLGTEASNV